MHWGLTKQALRGELVLGNGLKSAVNHGEYVRRESAIVPPSLAPRRLQVPALRNQTEFQVNLKLGLTPRF